VAAVENAAERLGKAGARVREVVLPEEFAGLRNAARETINNYERAARWGEWVPARRISDRLRQRIEIGRMTPPTVYLLRSSSARTAARNSAACSTAATSARAGVNGEAPLGLSGIGDPGFRRSGRCCTRLR
jgi:Asp-tRNA(Asn)/Glu-tRNA(Gln) amidotransferase A subunit family amidase